MTTTKLAIAEHLLNNSYKALGDPKILLSVLQNVLDAIEEGITTSLETARQAKQIPPYSDTFNGKITAFKMHLAKQKRITPLDFMLISEIQELLLQHKNAPVEFRRQSSFIMADDEFSLHTITPEKTKTYIERTKSLLSRL